MTSINDMPGCCRAGSCTHHWPVERNSFMDAVEPGSYDRLRGYANPDQLTEVLAGAVEQDNPAAAARLRSRIWRGSKRAAIFLLGDPERLVTDPYELL
jgi:hypothetical protein